MKFELGEVNPEDIPQRKNFVLYIFKFCVWYFWGLRDDFKEQPIVLNCSWFIVLKINIISLLLLFWPPLKFFSQKYLNKLKYLT